MAVRNYRKYSFENPDGTIIRKGITRRPLEERERELRRTENKPKGRIRQQGLSVSYESAREWEDRQQKGTPPGGQRRRKR